MSCVKWIKITTDIFDDEKILLIESLPEGDSIIVIWFKLLCMAGKQNNSGIFVMNDRMPYTTQMLATIFRRKESTVEMALNVFEQYGMIEIINDTITIPKWEYHQNIDTLDRIREQTRERVAKHRERQSQKMLSDSSEKDSNVTVTLRNANVTHIEEDKEEEEDKDKDTKDILSGNSTNFTDCASTEVTEAEKIRQIIGHLNEVRCAHYTTKSEKTRKCIRARLAEGHTVEEFFAVIDKMDRVWRGTKMEGYLRPETLFGTKFEGYLNRVDKTDAELEAEEQMQKKYRGLMNMINREGGSYDTTGVCQDDSDPIGSLPKWEGI